GRYAADPSERQLLRQSLLRFVAHAGRDPDVRRVLAQAAERSLADPQALDLGIRRTAWAVGVQELGKPFADKVEALVLGSQDSHIRDDAVYALGRAQDPVVADRARALLLDKRAEITTTGLIVWLQMGDPVTRPAFWSWLSANREALLDRFPGMFRSYL